MGAAGSKVCGGCFGGLLGGKKLIPDSSPQARLAANQVATLKEALALERPGAGSFIPSPPARTHSPVDWASPVPREKEVPPSAAAVSIDFDLCIEEVSASQGCVATQLDTDRRFGPSTNRRHSRFEVEQMLASPKTLPKPMTPDEREGAIRTLLPTATYQMLAKVPRQLLTSANPDGQTLRRNLARGATIVVVSAGLPGKRFTFERAAALGMKVVIIEHPDSWSQVLVKEGLVAKFMPVDMSQGSEEVYQQALEQIRKLGQDGQTGAADGIATFVELAVPLVARLAEALGLPGHRPAAVDSARNKHATRGALKAAGLPTPRNSLIMKPDDVAPAGQLVGFPAVLKPASGAASLGVKKVCNEAELMGTYQEIVAELKTLVVTSGALVKGTPESGGVDASKMIDLSVLMEQYLDGCEVDVDVVMSEGEWQYAAVADNGPTMEPYFNETWAVCPSLLPKEQQQTLKELAVASVKAIGFTAGVFHVECKMTTTGPQLIEVNARMGGGQVHECNLRCWGVDLVEETLFASLGIPARPPVPKQPLVGVAYAYVNAPFSGKVTDLSKLEALGSRPGVVWAKPLVRVGAEVTGPEKGLPTWLCDVFVTQPSAKEALDFLQALERENPVSVVAA